MPFPLPGVLVPYPAASESPRLFKTTLQGSQELKSNHLSISLLPPVLWAVRQGEGKSRFIVVVQINNPLINK